MVMALFFRNGIKCENHSATILLLKEMFDIDNSTLSQAKKERIDKQYYVETSASREDDEDLIRTADIFILHILDVIARTTNEKIARHREKLRTLIE
jgi:uncharacterized protein (UPF0332 family)